MTIKSFFIALIVGFVLYEIFAVIIGVHKKKKQQKELQNHKESEVLDNDTKQDN